MGGLKTLERPPGRTVGESAAQLHRTQHIGDASIRDDDQGEWEWSLPEARRQAECALAAPWGPLRVF